jgi:hypothetical protein
MSECPVCKNNRAACESLAEATNPDDGWCKFFECFLVERSSGISTETATVLGARHGWPAQRARQAQEKKQHA